MSDEKKTNVWIPVLVGVAVVGAVAGWMFAKRRRCTKGECKSGK